MRQLISILLTAALGLTGVPASADGCTDGSAFIASADRPHIVDPAGDANGSALAAPGVVDIDRVWLSTTDRTLPTTYVLNIAVVAPGGAPRSTGFIATFGDQPVNPPWIAATTDEAGRWTFSTGGYLAQLFLAGEVYEPSVQLIGEVDAQSGVISIRVPRDIIGDAEVAAGTYNAIEVRSALITPTRPQTTGINVGVPFAVPQTYDTLANAARCTIDLRPPAEDGDAS